MLDNPETRRPRLVAAELSQPFSYSGLTFLDGWFGAEPWGVWTDGRHSSLKLRLAEPPSDGFKLLLGINDCVSDTFPSLRFSIRVNGVVLARAGFDWPDGPWILAVDVPDTLGAQRDYLIEFDFAEVRSPREQGTGGDPRPLGLGVYWFEVTQPSIQSA